MKNNLAKYIKIVEKTRLCYSSNMNKLADSLKDEFGVSTPILLEEIMGVCSDITRDGVYRRIRRAIADGSLVKQENGIYYVPTKTQFGNSVLSEDAVLAKRYISDSKMVYGYVTGLALENRTGVSQQVPGVLEIVTNRETTRSRRIGRRGGWREVILRKPRISVTAENVGALEALDLVTSASLDSLDFSELENLKSKVKSVPVAILLECLKSYPAKTAKKLMESGCYGLLA